MKFELEKYHRNTPDNDFIQDIKNVAQKINKDTVTISEYQQFGKYHSSTITNRFGSWFIVLEKAGLKPSATKANVSDEELFNNIRNVWINLARQPRRDDLKKPVSKFYERPYYRRFGTWRKALEAFIEYINYPETEEVKSKNNETINKSHSNNEKPKRRTKKDISEMLRFSILMRYGFRCKSCGSRPLNSH